MNSERLLRIHSNQRGLTLVELMIAIVLFGIVAGAMTMTFAHVFTASARTSQHMSAIRQVQSAGYWVSQDTLQAQEVDTSSELLKLTWTDPATNYEYEVTYSLVDMASGELKHLRRVIKVTPPGEDATTTASFIANYIDHDGTDCSPVGVSLPEGESLSFTVTATVGGQTETRVYEVTPRAGT